MAQKKYRKYEVIYLVQPEATDEERQKISDRVDLVIEEGDCWLAEREDWGKRKLAYEINKQNKAYYTYLTLLSAPGVTAELERVLRLLDGVIRFMTIKLEDNIPEDKLAELLKSDEPEPEAVVETEDAAPAAEEAAPVAEEAAPAAAEEATNG